MLQNTFLHIPGLDIQNEQALWEKGITSGHRRFHIWRVYSGNLGTIHHSFHKGETQNGRKSKRTYQDR